MLIVSNLYYSIQGRTILKGVSFTLDRERKFIVGANGSGKTTLLEIIMSIKQKDYGSVEIKGSVAYVPQEIKDIEKTGLEVIEEGVYKVKEIENELKRLEGNVEDYEYYALLLEEYERLNGYGYKSEILSLLSDFDLDEKTVAKPLSKMSGGERTKCLIVRALLSKPDLLILDEPTNNLDIETIENLEKYLLSFKGGLLIVSHDKVLINRLATHILYLENGVLKEYPGNYDKFISIKTIEDESLRKEREQLLKYIEKERRFIEKFRYGTRSKQALSREKQLEKIEIPEIQKKKELKLEIESGDIGSEKVLELKGVKKSYGAVNVLNGIDLKILRSDRIAIIGKNGSGKTTLLKIIVGELDKEAGSIYLGPSVEFRYFPQDEFVLNPKDTLLDVMLKEGLEVSEARSYLAEFNFVNDDVFKTVSELSGGEKRRLLLAKMGLISSNFLILDEPTNHLDIETIELLINALKNYKGSILLVSHDRYLISSIAKKVYRLEHGKLVDLSMNRTENKNSQVDKARIKEINKIKARIAYLEKLLKDSYNKKKEEELKILRKKLERLK